MRTIRPTDEQIKEFMNLPDEKPLVMINLLRFKKTSEEGQHNRKRHSVICRSRLQ